MTMSTILHIAAPGGGEHLTAVAGPCAVESHEMALETAVAVQAPAPLAVCAVGPVTGA
jgi:3-deoxy-D-arabino-heptulosonate 7-phosphate (DAHP) synthase